METYYGAAAIAGICVLVVLMGMMKQKGAGLIAAFALRCFAGAIGICVMNEVLKSLGIAASAGVSPVNLVAVGTLGISGFVLIYAILLYRLFGL